MTLTATARSISYVVALTHSASRVPCRPVTLTKRRAVDFCRVATAICPVRSLPLAR